MDNNIYRFASLIVFSFLIGCEQKHINPYSIDKIVLVQVDYPYIANRVDSIKLDDKLVADFLNDFVDKKEEITKFYSCYVIKIYFKNGELISYRTNGQLLEKFKDKNTRGTYFKLNNDLNLVTKYWGISQDQFCITTNPNDFIETTIDFILKNPKNNTIELRDIYNSLVSHLPPDSNEVLILAESLKKKGFKVIDWGRGNHPPLGPRIVSLTLQKDSCICEVNKIYYFTTVDTLFEITERIKCHNESK